MSNPTTPTDGTGLVLTCMSCDTTWEPQDDDANSFVCPTEGCTGGGLLTARLANGPEPTNPTTTNIDRQRDGHLPGCLCLAGEDEWCYVVTAEGCSYVPDYADEEDRDCIVQVERTLPGYDGVEPGDVVVIEPRSGKLRYRLVFAPEQVPALIEGLRAAVELLTEEKAR